MQRSDSINELAAALAKAQASIRFAAKENLNPHFRSKYADLSSVWDSCRDALSANGLSVTQVPTMGAEGGLYLVTTIMHASGQWISGEWPIRPVQDTPQGLGSATTYARRYSLAAMVGVAPADEDDDGNAASAGNGAPAPAVKPKPPKGITELKNEMRSLRARLDECETPKDVDTVLDEYADIIERCKKDAPEWWFGDGKDIQGAEKYANSLRTKLMGGSENTILAAG